MKRNIITLLTILLIMSCGNIPVEQADSIIDDIKNEYCPDSRIAIFDISREQNGRTVTLSGESNLPDAVKALSAELEEKGYRIANRILLLPSPDLRGKIYGVVSRSVINIRTEPRFGRSEMATQAVLGSPLNIY